MLHLHTLNVARLRTGLLHRCSYLAATLSRHSGENLLVLILSIGFAIAATFDGLFDD
jgi:hypothetical protein